MQKTKDFHLRAAALILLAASAPALAATPWSKVALPSNGPTRVIGGAANGCVGGAEALPESGPGYVSVRRHRNRHYGHPDLIRLIEDLGRAMQRRGDSMVMIGDLSQPRGGRMPSSHRSHQNGLDTDVWFTLAPSLNASHRLMDSGGDPPSMVSPGGMSVNDRWGADQRFLIEAAARDAAVDRIFVNAAIKQALCRSAGGDRGWLRKIRPWWGHDAHFHVRLRCPAGSPQCAGQGALPAGDGCGTDLAWWFSDEARNPSKGGKSTPEPQPPGACMALLR
jgi:penicillin-insensitive murein endopeptidase